MLVQEDAAVMPISDEVLQAAERIDDDRLIADTLITRGTALSNLRRWREGSAVIDKAMAIAEAAGRNDIWLRGLNNSVLLTWFLDPVEAKDRTEAGLALARRIGQDRWVKGLWTQLATFYLRTGGWDEGLEELDRVLAETTDARTRENMVLTLATLRASRGENIDEQVRELEATTEVETGVQSKLTLREAYGWQAFVAGRLDAAAAHWSELFETEPSALVTGNAQWVARLAIWKGDIEAADRWQALHWEWVPHGGASELDHLALVAAVQALRGDRSGAVARYRDIIGRYRELKLDVEIGYMAIDMAYVLGSTEAVTLEAVAIGRAALTVNHARLLLDQLEVALAHGAHPAGGREASSPKQSRKAGVPTS
jgi:hypothetical protein